MKNCFKEIQGGVTAPHAFMAGSVFAGIKAANKSKPDIALIFSQVPAVAAGTFTTNRVQAAPVKVSQTHVRGAKTWGIVANSGNANACTGKLGLANAKRMIKAAAKLVNAKSNEMLVCSTGRIGVQLPIEKMEAAIAKVTLSDNGSLDAAKAIMTSDTKPKEIAVELRLNGKRVRIGGIAKGAGMIDPNMATMLCFVTTDAVISKTLLQQATSAAVEQSFNRITIDGDMSTNDTVLVLANGMANHEPLAKNTPEFAKFQSALNHICRELARMMVEDGEGVSKFVDVHVRGAKSRADARLAAEAIANSTLTKCSWYGGDPNWGRIMDAVGYSGAKIREEKIDIFYNDGVYAVKNGAPAATPSAALKKAVGAQRFSITVDLHLGKADYVVYTTDLTTAYVDFNKGE